MSSLAFRLLDYTVKPVAHIRHALRPYEARICQYAFTSIVKGLEVLQTSGMDPGFGLKTTGACLAVSGTLCLVMT